MRVQLYQGGHQNWHLSNISWISFSTWSMTMCLCMTPLCGTSQNCTLFDDAIFIASCIMHQPCICGWNTMAHTQGESYFRWTNAKDTKVYWIYWWHFDWNSQALAKRSTSHMVWWVEKDIWNEQHSHFRPSWVVHLHRHLVILAYHDVSILWHSNVYKNWHQYFTHGDDYFEYWDIQPIWVSRCLLCEG